MRIWARDDLPQEWQPAILRKPIVVSLGSGRFIVVDFLGVMGFGKDHLYKIVPRKEYGLFTGIEVAFSNGTDGSGNESGHQNSSSGDENENGGKGKGMIRGRRMMKHKSRRYMFNKSQRIEAVL